MGVVESDKLGEKKTQVAKDRAVWVTNKGNKDVRAFAWRRCGPGSTLTPQAKLLKYVVEYHQ